MDYRHIMSVTLLAAVSLPALSQQAKQQIEAQFGFNHSTLSYSQLSTGSGQFVENDRLKPDSANNDVLWGVGYAYDILPIFAAYQVRTPEQWVKRVWLGADLLFVNVINEGDLYQYLDPAQNNYHYQSKFNTARLMANSEIDFKSWWPTIFPTFQMSVGAAKIDATYQDHPNTPAQQGSIHLSKRTNYNLAYSLGAGIKYMPLPYYQMQVSYLFTDFGLVKFEDSSLDARLYSSTGMLTFSYLF